MTITPTNVTPSKQSAVDSEVDDIKHGIVSFYESVCGSTHPKNEDSIHIAPPFYGLADGVGGGAAGDVASATLLKTCASANMQTLDNEALIDLIYLADADIKRALSQVSSGRGASTLACVWLDNQSKGFFTWVGDARIYAIRRTDTEAKLTQLTVDHTYRNVKDSVPEGWDPDDPAYMIGIGRQAIGKPQRMPIDLEKGDGLLLCSDGVHKFLAKEIMSSAFRSLEAQSGLAFAIKHYASRLVDLAIENGSYDDCSALVVFHNADSNSATSSLQFENKGVKGIESAVALPVKSTIETNIVTESVRSVGNPQIDNNEASPQDDSITSIGQQQPPTAPSKSAKPQSFNNMLAKSIQVDKHYWLRVIFILIIAAVSGWMLIHHFRL